MYRIAHRFSLRAVVALVICTTLLPLPGLFSRRSKAAQPERDLPAQKGKPRPGKPDGELPDLEDVKNESPLEREAPLAIPSSVRSNRNAGKPWDGRRVGDPEPPRNLDQVRNTSPSASFGRSQQIRRAGSG